jgi:hypothetical protein
VEERQKQQKQQRGEACMAVRAPAARHGAQAVAEPASRLLWCEVCKMHCESEQIHHNTPDHQHRFDDPVNQYNPILLEKLSQEMWRMKMRAWEEVLIEHGRRTRDGKPMCDGVVVDVKDREFSVLGVPVKFQGEKLWILGRRITRDQDGKLCVCGTPLAAETRNALLRAVRCAVPPPAVAVAIAAAVTSKAAAGPHNAVPAASCDTSVSYHDAAEALQVEPLTLTEPPSTVKGQQGYKRNPNECA